MNIALISEQASPLGTLGGVDSGGQNVYVAQIAKGLAAMGHRVDVFTRKDSPDLPSIADWEYGARVIHVPAGPPRFVPKEELLPFMEEITAHFMRSAWRRTYDVVHANFWMSGMVAAEAKRRLGVPFVTAWCVLTARFCARRLRNTSRAPRHIAEMAVTSAAIPVLSLFWRVVGAIRYCSFVA